MKQVLLFLALLITLFSAVSEAGTMKIRLDELSFLKDVRLNCVSGSHNISVPIPARWLIKNAVVDLRYASSPNLIEETSKLFIKLNEFPVGHTVLTPIMKHKQFKLELPHLMFEPGYNMITFEVLQHFSRQECEFPCAPDLWTHLKLDESYITLEYDLKPLPTSLATLAKELFDPKIYPHGEVNIIIEEITSDIINSAAIVASGVARRFDYRKVKFTVSRDIKPGMDNLLIGRKEFVTGFLEKKNRELEEKLKLAAAAAEFPDEKKMKVGEITAGYLKLMHLPLGEPVVTNDKGPEFFDDTHGLLVVSGRNFNDVKIASETLAHISFPFPGSDEMRTMEFKMPDISLYSGRQVLTANKVYDFKTLNFRTHTFRGFNAPPKEITFRLPADFLIKRNKTARLSLSLAYGPGMGPTSTLNISLNGEIIRSIHVDQRSGSFIEDYEINIPTYMFKVGSNTISFAPHLAPEAELCDFIQTGNMYLTIFEDSTLYFPSMPHFVELPKLELFMLNGFPLTRWPDGFESLIYIPNPDYNTIAASMNIIGMITQKNGFPLFGLKLSMEPVSDWDGEMLVVGASENIPKSLFARAPLQFGQQSVVPYPVVRSWEGAANFAFSKQESELGRNAGMLMEFESPVVEGRSVILITAGDSMDLLRFSEAAMDPVVQSRAEGDLVLVELTPPDYKVTAFSAGPKYTVGKSGKISKLDYYLITYPYLYYVAVGGVIVISGLITFVLLKRIRRGRIARDD